MHQFRNLRPFWLTCAAISFGLVGCAGPRIVYRDRTISVPVPVRAPLDPRLTADCVPDVEVPPTGPLPVADVLRRLDAVEMALGQCRAQVGELRSIK